MGDSIERLGIRVLEETERANRAERERDYWRSQCKQAWEKADQKIGDDMELSGLCYKVAVERDAALERERRLREALLDSLASLVAATSLLERGGMNAAPSDKMFRQMKEDYEKSIERARGTLANTPEDNRDA